MTESPVEIAEWRETLAEAEEHSLLVNSFGWTLRAQSYGMPSLSGTAVPILHAMSHRNAADEPSLRG
jgi:hypothetical protein